MNGISSRAVISLSRPAISSVSAGLSMTQGPAIRNNGRSTPTSCPASFMSACLPSGTRSLRQLGRPLHARRADEPGEQRMPVARRRGELRVELRGDEPRVIGQLDQFDEPIAREAAEAQARLPVALKVGVVELVAVAMPLHDELLAEDLARPGAGAQQHLLRAEAHGGALLATR